MEIIRLDNKYKCPSCAFLSDDLIYLEIHFKKDCEGYKYYKNYQIFDPDTCGKKIFGDKYSGNIYITKTERAYENDYKIGITTELSQRFMQLRTSVKYDPQFIYYFPCQNINKIDSILNRNLKRFQIDREIFEGNLEELKNTILEVLKIFGQENILIFQPKIKTGDFVDCKICNKIFINKKIYNLHSCINIEENKQENKIIECVDCQLTLLEKNLSRHKTICNKENDTNKKIIIDKDFKKLFSKKRSRIYM